MFRRLFYYLFNICFMVWVFFWVRSFTESWLTEVGRQRFEANEKPPGLFSMQRESYRKRREESARGFWQIIWPCIGFLLNSIAWGLKYIFCKCFCKAKPPDQTIQIVEDEEVEDEEVQDEENVEEDQ